ncbi:hypothetical protein [Pseudarthrobacter polychromogenes]|uniref:Uncharacterized protein n=1 Tax=Pseudarthrobacter polychromogenes TaxID=1676 RepID=A0ABQ1Y481_9MICC|nr:hypothetical protein [Pseudarthrobacter polychromogenes]GGH10883.1 hypothetical protein GCM10011577_39870 [Pseudarthrobacter polychromogenes]
MAVSEFALALSALLGTLLVPFFLLYQMLRLKRRAVRITAPAAAPRGNRR